MSFLNLQNVKDEFEVLPAAFYNAVITKAEMKESKNNPYNTYLSIETTICDEMFKGRKIFTMLNILHPTEKARNIALSQLKKLLVSIKEKLEFKNAEELIETILDKRVSIKVTIESDATYGTRNVIKGFAEFTNRENEVKADLPF